ncbi:MAG: hypothetical protein KDK89_12650 [Alphaproteobacteria bacterium]|nr:hypothetical protein [Alphaproteobacteria bacterium]
MKVKAVCAMLAQAGRRREWRYAVAAGLLLLLTGCGGSKIGELLKDSPSQEQKP